MHTRYSKISNFPINVILMQPTTSHETFPTDSDQVDFESPSKYRTFPIYVKDKVFFVDSHVFCKNSDYFKVMMSSNQFLEGTLGRIEISDESPEDILTLIRVISPNYLGLYPDEINEENVCTILRICEKFLIYNLKHNCLDFLEEYDPSNRPLSMVLYLLYHLCFSLQIEYEHDVTLCEIANKTMYACLAELLKTTNINEVIQIRNELIKDECSKHIEKQIFKRITDTILRGNVIFEHRLSFNEEVQGLGCHQCSKRPSARSSRFNHGKTFVLYLCKSCSREVCVQCRRKPCSRLFDEWLNEIRS